MTLKSCSPIVGVDVMSFDTEKEVLLAWRVIISIQAAHLNFNLSDFKFEYQRHIALFALTSPCLLVKTYWFLSNYFVTF